MKKCSQLKETPTLKANGRLTVRNTVLFQIYFTMEKESENRLPFLDVLIDNNQVPVLTTVFRKSTALLAFLLISLALHHTRIS